MSDFQKLSDQNRSILQIKLDGHIEACIQAAQIYSIGLSEALDLMLLASLREFQARQYDRSTVTAVFEQAADQTHPKPVADRPRLAS